MSAPRTIYEDETHSSMTGRGSLSDRADLPPDSSGEEEGGAYGDELREGPLLRLKDREVARYNLRLWEDQDDLYAQDRAMWEVNELRRIGVPHVQLLKESGRQGWRAWYPPTAQRGGSDGMNKAATLCRRTIAVLFADPPVADPVPASGSVEDQGATEFAARAIQELQSEPGLNTVTKARRAMDRASTCGVTYTHTFVDPYGKLEPVRIEAHPNAPHADVATLDPETGLPAPGPFVLRYVREDGTLTDEEREAAREWFPVLRKDLLHPRNVRLHPHTADDLWEADGATIAVFMAWRDVRGLFPEAREANAEVAAACRSFRPQHAPQLLDKGVRGRRALEDQQREDDQLTLVVTTYYRSCADYPEGCHVTTIADQLCVVQETLAEELPDETGAVARRVRDIPLSAYLQFDDGRQGPTKAGLMEFLGPGNETRQTLLGLLLDSLQRAAQRKIFVPTSSILNPRDLTLPSMTVIPINPGGQPFYEQLPDTPLGAFQLVETLSQELDSDSGLQQAGQGLETASVTSGEQAKTILAQVHAGLSELRENAIRGYLRDCRIELQLAKAYYSKPRRVRWEGEDGRHNERWWTGADLAATDDVRVKVGTMTMLSPAVKSDLALHYAQTGLLEPDELHSILASNMGGTIGLQDNPYRKRVKRQVSEWLQGPPEDWQPALAQPMLLDPVTQQPVLDPATGGPMPDMQAPPLFDPLADPASQAIWTRTPADQLPRVAMLRAAELGRVMQGERYAGMPKMWRAGLDAEFLLMQQAVQMAMQTDPQSAAPSGGGNAPPGSPHSTEQR